MSILSSAIFVRRLLVAEAVDVEPLVDAALDPRLRRIGALDAAVVGVRSRTASGRASPARRSCQSRRRARAGRRTRSRSAACRVSRASLGGHAAGGTPECRSSPWRSGGRGQLEHRVVGMIGERQRRDMPHQGLGLDVLPVPRSTGHLHCRCRSEIQCWITSPWAGLISSDCFSASSAAPSCGRPPSTRPELLQRHQLVLDGVAVDAGRLLTSASHCRHRRRRAGPCPPARGRG